MTTPQRWQEIDRIFAAALEVEQSERARFLTEACAGDEDLRKEVESLLTHDSAESMAGGSAVEQATRLLTQLQTSELENKTIGPYKIGKSLGGGGMGHVYLGHDTRLNRPVAIKLLSFYHAPEKERTRRFRQEALAVSALNHPNILTIYDVCEADGENFIVTEFVQGLKLSEQRFVPPYHIALLYNALGETEETFKWLERAVEVGDAKLAFLKVEPKWNNLRDDARFRDLMRRVGF